MKPSYSGGMENEGHNARNKQPLTQWQLAAIANKPLYTIAGNNVGEQAVSFASQFIGQGDNGATETGVIPSAFTELLGSGNLGWCGDFMYFVYQKIDPSLFTREQLTYTGNMEALGRKSRALYYRNAAGDFEGYTPRAGDVVLFAPGSERNPDYHGAIVESYDASTKTLALISGNVTQRDDARGVVDRLTIDLNHPQYNVAAVLSVEQVAAYRAEHSRYAQVPTRPHYQTLDYRPGQEAARAPHYSDAGREAFAASI